MEDRTAYLRSVSSNGGYLRRKEQEQLRAIQERRKIIRSRRQVRRFFVQLALFSLLIWVLFFKVFGLCAVPDNDMAPRLSAGDILLYDRLSRDYKASDSVVYEAGGKRAVGRIIAVSGDLVEINNEQGLLINGSDVTEESIYEETKPYADGIDYPVRLGQGEYFILCDRRDGARDSRLYGPVPQSQILGRAILALRRSGL